MGNGTGRGLACSRGGAGPRLLSFALTKTLGQGVTKPSQSGIAIAPILFVVGILAVLATAIAAGSGSFNSDTSAVKAKAQAASILEYADQLKKAVDRVRMRGCLDTQVSFENPLHGNYTNPNAPGDKSCHIFDPNGGGISFLPIKVSELEVGNDGYFEFQGVHQVPKLGKSTLGDSESTELIGFLPLDSLNLCKKINEMLGVSGSIGIDKYRDPGIYAFKGTYTSVAIIGDDVIGSWEDGLMMGCLQKTSGYPTLPPIYAPYFFYAVLIVR